MLKNFCIQNKYNYIEITDKIIDITTKIINPKYLNKNVYNHHLDDESTYKFWLEELYKIINSK